MDVTARFSNRVQDYLRARPGYPAEAIDYLCNEMHLDANSVVADIGSGTGILTRRLLERVGTVHAVEPNGPMREAAEALLGNLPGFHSHNGTAEATGLPDHSIDAIFAAQAFHWFDPPQARAEFQRILRPNAQVALLWNTRHLDTTPFLRGYEALLQQFATDYTQVDHRNIDEAALTKFFGARPTKITFPNRQELDYDGLQSRLLSCSYAPAQGHPNHEPMLQALQQLFATHAKADRVHFEYDTEIHFGHLK